MSRYTAAHTSPRGPGDARPTALQVIQDEVMENEMGDKVIVITGTSSGIGIETVRTLSATGAKFFLTARDIAKAKAALVDIFEPSRMELVEMDQISLESVRVASNQILSKTKKINILIANAGIMAIPNLQFTKDGHELQFGTNHLSHFLLFELLKPALLAAVTPEFNSRVVVVSSSAHAASGINSSDNYNYQNGGYHPWIAYGQSKTANIYMANELERRYGAQGLHATSLHPGLIATPLTRHMTEGDLAAFAKADNLQKLVKSPEQGAATTVWAAIGKQWKGKGGKYLTDCAEAEPSNDESFHYGSEYAKHAYDPESEGRLWEDSLKLVRAS